MSGGKNLAQRADTIIDVINRECDSLSNSECTMVHLFVREVIDSVVRIDFVDAILQKREDDAIAEYEADNAKLRELLLELYEDQCDSGDQWRYLDRMSELGVEVDE